MNAEILTIGSELLNGSTLNTNAKFLGEALTSLGFCVLRQSSCPDSKKTIQSHVLDALSRAQVLVLSGGLGPTPDDVTRESLAELLGVPLVFSKAQFREISRLYKRLGWRMTADVRKEAEFPKNSVPLVNHHGIALGFYIPYEKDKWIIVLPGVPRELEKMFEELVRPLLVNSFPGLKVPCSLEVRMAGISEPEVMRRLKKDFFEDVFDFGIYPYPGRITVRVQSDRSETIRKLRRKIQARLKGFIFSEDGSSLEEVIGNLLVRKKKTVAVAESCTGGLLSAAFTKVPGASRYFRGGVVAYDNSVKSGVLSVEPSLIRKHGAVSGEVAHALALGVKEKMKSNYALGITGIAGPGGAVPGKPVGTVWFSLISDSQTWSELFFRDRAHIQERAVTKALEKLWRHLV